MVAPPPEEIVFAVERIAPGAYSSFLLRFLIAAWVARVFSATSWFRTTERNAAVGGHPESAHLVGLAIDVPPSPRMAEVSRSLGLWVVEEGDHTHVQAWPPGVTGSVLRSLGV